jgi:hypothetical protein
MTTTGVQCREWSCKGRNQFRQSIGGLINTQAIEDLWTYAKKPFKAMNGTSKSLFNSHLEWFQFKHNVQSNVIFSIRFYYNREDAANVDEVVDSDVVDE